MINSPECRLIIQKLEKELPDYLQYHTVKHTLDVYHQAIFIADAEGLQGRDRDLLLVAVVYHDAGYLYGRDGHELKSCEIAREMLSGFGYSATDIETVCAIIMATSVPQNPLSLPEMIICDADLDYLGRDDFFDTGYGLYQEFLHDGVVKDEKDWNQLQVKFLESHHYFTETSKKNRNHQKHENLNILKHKLHLLNE